MKKLITSTLILASAGMLFADAEDGAILTDTTWAGESISITSPLIVEEGATFTIGDGVSQSKYSVETPAGISPISNTGKIVIAEGSELSLKTLTAEKTAMTLDVIDVYGTLRVYSGIQANNVVSKTLNVYGTLISDRGVIQTGTSDVLKFHNGSTLNTDYLYFGSSSSISTIVKIGNNVSFGNKLNTFTLMSYCKGTLDASSTDAKVVQLKNIALTTNNTLTIKLSDELFSVGTLTTIKTDMAASKLIFEDFKNDLFKIEDFSNITVTKDGVMTFEGKGGSLTITAKDTDGATINIADYDGWYFTDDGFLNIAGYPISAVVAVPEPAEWAAIFGAIALGLAIYRRRK